MNGPTTLNTKLSSMEPEMVHSKPTTKTDNSNQKEPGKIERIQEILPLENWMDLSNPTTKTDNSNQKEPGKMENGMDNPMTGTYNSDGKVIYYKGY